MRETNGRSGWWRARAAFAASLCALALLTGASARQEPEGAGQPDCAGAACFEVSRVESCEGANCLEAVAAEGCEEAPCFALRQVEECEGGSCFRLFRRPEKDMPVVGKLGTSPTVSAVRASKPRPRAVQAVERRNECKTDTCFEIKQVKDCKSPPCFAAVRKDQCVGPGCFVVTKF